MNWPVIERLCQDAHDPSLKQCFESYNLERNNTVHDVGPPDPHDARRLISAAEELYRRIQRAESRLKK